MLKPLPPPSLYGVKSILDKSIAGNNAEKLLTFVTLLTAYVKNNEQFLLLRGSTSAGKTYMARNVKKLFPPEHIYNMNFSSETAPWYEQDLSGCKIIDASELQKHKDEVKEIIKSIHSRDEGASRAVTDMTTKSTLKYKIEPKTILITFAGEFFDIQLGTRCISIDLAEDWGTNEQVVKWVTENAENPFKNEVESHEIERIRNHIRGIPMDFVVIVPYMSCFVNSLDRRYVRIRSDIEKHIALISAITLWNHAARYKTEINDKNYIFATPEDAYIAYSAFGEILSKTTSQMGDIHQTLIDISKEITNGTISDYHDKMIKQKLSIHKKNVEQKLESLVNLGLMRMEKIKGTKHYSYNENLAEAIKEVDWKKVENYTYERMERDYKEHLLGEKVTTGKYKTIEEYRGGYRETVSDWTQHPLTGNDITFTQEKTLLVPVKLLKENIKIPKEGTLDVWGSGEERKKVIEKLEKIGSKPRPKNGLATEDKSAFSTPTTKTGCLKQDECPETSEKCSSVSYACDCKLN